MFNKVFVWQGLQNDKRNSRAALDEPIMCQYLSKEAVGCQELMEQIVSSLTRHQNLFTVDQ
jgi:hypothetical protein